jgi:FkbM family methyltransferase
MIKKLFHAAGRMYQTKVSQKVRRRIATVIWKTGLIQSFNNSLYKMFQPVLLDFIKSGQLTGMTDEQQNILKSAAPRHEVVRNLWLTFYDTEKQLFDFNCAKIPNFLSHISINKIFDDVCVDTLLVPLFFADRPERKIVERLELIMLEGPYGWQDGDFDVTVHKGDIVIDAGAWIGDFAAYAASKGASVYAFEPTAEIFAMLEETAQLNGHITPVRKGLGQADQTVTLYHAEPENSGGNTTLRKRLLKDSKNPVSTETIDVTSLDDFVRENSIPRIDFIKVDIEGAERDMLKGARHVLKTFAPRLALCTYHLPDDPEVMARLIKEANPDYRIVQRRHKLYACVPG